MKRILTIFLFNHNHINGSAESRRINGIPCLRDGTADTPHVLHRAGSSREIHAESRYNVANKKKIKKVWIKRKSQEVRGELIREKDAAYIRPM